VGAKNLFVGILGIRQNVRKKKKMEKVIANIHRSILLIELCPLLE
jgi:hypothetical protein